MRVVKALVGLGGSYRHVGTLRFEVCSLLSVWFLFLR